MKLDIQLFADNKLVIETGIDETGALEDLEKLAKDLSKEDFDDFYKAMEEGIRDAVVPEIEERMIQLRELLNAYQKELNAPIIYGSSHTEALEEYKQEIQQVKSELEALSGEKITIPSLEKSSFEIDKIGKGLNKVVKKVAGWGLALLGVRGVYGAIRSAMSTIASQDSQLKADLDYMKNAIAYTLEPIVRRIVELMKTLMFYVGYIVKAWTGKNIFENANKGLKKATGSAKGLNKELSKTNASFDEMNVLQDNSGGGSGVGGGMPSFDLTSLDIEVPQWIQWIADNGELIIGIISGIAGGLLAMKLSDFAKSLKLVKTGLTGIQALGIGVIVAGIVLLIQDIIDMISDPSWENFVAILGDIAIVIGGIMLLTGNWWGLLVAIIGLAVKLIAENWDKIKEILGKVWGWIDEHIITPIVNGFKGVLVYIMNHFITPAITTFNNLKDAVVKVWTSIKDRATEIFTSVKTFITDKIITPIKTAFEKLKTGIVSIFDGIKSSVVNVLNKIISGINTLIKGANKVKFDVPSWVPGIGGKKFGFNIKEISAIKLAKGGIINMPSKGVAIGGESGKEGVIPLTDSQQMALLGEAIGRYITINASITNTMNGRIISRELQKINNENAFANNR